jgi:FMN-dependent NADH-azoreductase
MKTLLINAHPDFTNGAHFSVKLQEKFVEKFMTEFSAEDLTVLNLYDMEIPRIEADGLLTIWDKQMKGLDLTAEEAHLAAVSADLLAQFKAHHRVVIATPLHNFNITSRMKDYLDNILIARETFKYLTEPDARGKISAGLLDDDYRALMLFSSGSIYTQGFYTALDFAPQYLKAMFAEVMGFDDFGIVRAEGTAVLAENDILAAAESDLAAAFGKLYH